jgi:hypothetical protein
VRQNVERAARAARELELQRLRSPRNPVRSPRGPLQRGTPDFSPMPGRTDLIGPIIVIIIGLTSGEALGDVLGDALSSIDLDPLGSPTQMGDAELRRRPPPAAERPPSRYSGY